MVSDEVLDLLELTRGRIIVRNVSVSREGSRFKVYLPTANADLWSLLNELGARVDLVVIVRDLEGLLKRLRSRGG